MKSYELMGREADKATQDVQSVTAFLSQLGSEQAAAALLTVTIERASWGNGTLALQTELQAVVRNRAGELIAEALGNMQTAAANRVATLRQAIAGLGAEPPAASPAPAAALVLDSQSAGAILGASSSPNGPLVPAPEVVEALGVWDGLSRQARELLVYLRKNGPSVTARTQERTDLHRAKLILEQGSGPKATWALTELGEQVAAAAA